MAQPFVFDDGSVADSLIFTEDTIGKRNTVPSHLQRPVWEVVKFDIFASQALRYFVAFQDDLLAVVVEAQLRADIALFTMAQDIVQSTWSDVERTMQVIRSGRVYGKF